MSEELKGEKMDDLKELYAQLGELQIQSEIIQGRMNEARQSIARFLNRQAATPKTPPKLEEVK